MREQRPSREQTSDNVHFLLHTQGDLLAGCLHKLAKGAATVDLLVSRLRDSLAGLKQDAADKVHMHICIAA